MSVLTDKAELEAVLNRMEKYLTAQYEVNMPDYGYTVKEYESVRLDVEQSLWLEYKEMHAYYTYWLAYMKKNGGAKAFTKKDNDPRAVIGHRVWTMTGRVPSTRNYKQNAVDYVKPGTTTPKSVKGSLPPGIKHRPRVANRIMRDYAKDGAFVPDFRVLQALTGISAANWENAVILLEEYRVDVVDNGYILRKDSQRKVLQEAMLELEKEMRSLKRRMSELK